MRQPRSTPLPSLLLALIAWTASDGELVWARVGAHLADLPGHAAAPSTSEQAEISFEGPSFRRASGSRGARLPVSATTSCQYLEGELSRLECGLFADAVDGQWDQHSLLTAALVASGVVDPEAIRAYETQLAQLADELERSGTMNGSPASRAQTLFEFTHRRILRGGYQLDSTDLSLVLREGRFNCVSASVLFNCLAARFGLRACGLELPGHAMSRLFLPQGTLDVETTCPEWFRLMNDPEKQAELVEKTIGLRLQIGSSPLQRRQVSDVELVATIYYNRGVDLLAEKRFAEAAAANAKALRLDPSNTTARGNLLATINNWAIELDGEGCRPEALELLRQGIALDPGYETFKVNYVHVCSQGVEELCRAGRFREASELLARAEEGRVEGPYFRQARLDLCRRWARACFVAGQSDQAFAAFDEAKRFHDRLPEVLEAEVAEVNCQALNLVNEGRLAEAVALFDQALLRQPDSTLLAENRRATLMCWAPAASETGDYPEVTLRSPGNRFPPGRYRSTRGGPGRLDRRDPSDRD